MRIPRYTVLLLVSLIVSPIFFSTVFASDHGINDNELTSEEIIDDGEFFIPNNPIVLYYSWPNLVVAGEVAYRSNFYGFEILNLSDPKSVSISREFQLEEVLESRSLGLNDTLLFLSIIKHNNWSLGFQVYDVATTNNISIGQFFFNTSLVNFLCYGIYVKENYVYYLVNYLNEKRGGFLVADCSNITHPIEVGSYFFDGCWFQDLAIYNNYAYLLKSNDYENYDNGVQVIDLTNISALLKVSEILDSAHLNGFHCSDNKLFLVSNNGVLRIYNITNPTNLQLINFYSENDESFQDIYFSDNIAYVVKTSGCSVLDISDINSLKKIGHFKYTKERGAFRFGFVEDDKLYLQRHSEDPDRMLFILDVSTPEKPIMLYPSWIAPKWAFNELPLFLVILIIPPTIVLSIILFIVFLIVKRRRRKL